jgi:hypothetical protein
MKFKTEIEFEARMDAFIQELIAIQKRHYYWFESRHGNLKTQEHDVIANHVVITCRYPKLIFGYWSDSELPQSIREECNGCFDRLFGSDGACN